MCVRLTSGCEVGSRAHPHSLNQVNVSLTQGTRAFMSVLSLPGSEGRDSVPRSETGLEEGCATARVSLEGPRCSSYLGEGCGAEAGCWPPHHWARGLALADSLRTATMGLG